MTESPTPGKFAKWKRPLIGGLLSALVAVTGIAWQVSFDTAISTPIGTLIAVGFMGIPEIILVYSLPIKIDNIIIKTLMAAGIWFFIGAIISLVFKHKIVSILLWFLVLLFLCAISFVLLIPLWAS